MDYETKGVRELPHRQHTTRFTPPAALDDAVARPWNQILFALCGTDHPTAGMQRAVALCRVLGAELHLLRVLPELGPPQRGASDGVEMPAPTSIEPHLCWLERLLIDEISLDRVQVRRGALVEQAAAHASELRSDVIVLAPYETQCGTDVTELVHKSGLPVLVARAASASKVILAATNLDDPHFPVLAAASELAARFGSEVVAVHSVDPLSGMVCEGVASPIVRVDDTVAEKCAELLASVSPPLGPATRLVVSHEANPVSAILYEARARDADLLVVGTSPGSQWVATQIVDRVRSSVLVVPLTPTDASECASASGSFSRNVPVG